MSKLIAVAVAALFSVSVNSFAQAPKAPEKAAVAASTAKSEKAPAAETKAPAKAKSEKAAAKTEVKGDAKVETVKK